jgi:hypothetical protein
MGFNDCPQGHATMGPHQLHDPSPKRRLCVRTHMRVKRLAYVNASRFHMCSMKSASESENGILWAVEDRGFHISKTDNIVRALCWRAHRHHQLNTTRISVTLHNHLYTVFGQRLVVVGRCELG